MQFFFIRRGFFCARVTPGANMLYRKADLGPIDLEARSVPVTIASDNPVQRDGYLEILDLANVDLSRGDLPLIESHDADQINLGVVRDIHVVGNKLVGTAVFGTSARASEILADVQAKVVSGLSIGYALIGEGVPGVINGQPTRTFAFMPYECSVVACPADLNSGFFRSRKTISLKQGNTMETYTSDDAVEIASIGRQFKMPVDLTLRSIEQKVSLEEFRKLAMDHLTSRQVTLSGTYDGYATADRSTADPTKVLRSVQQIREHYADRSGGHQSGLGLADFMRAVAHMPTTELATRALAIGTDSAGGYAVPTVLMPGILEALVPVSSLVQAGAGILPLTDGAKTYNFAAIDTLPTAAWRAENGAVAESAPTFKNIEITPRSLSFMVKLSRELLHDARNIEQSLQQAIAQAFAIAIDRAGLMGSGTAPEPRGLKNTSGIQTVTNGAAGTVLGSYANVFSAVEKILVVNGPLPGAAIMAPRSLVKLGALADSTGQPLQVPTMLQGIKLLQTSQIPTNLVLTTSSDCSDIYVGDFTKMYVCMRENLNVQMLTEAYADYGQIAFVCHARVDFAVAYPQAFCLVSGVR